MPYDIVENHPRCDSDEVALTNSEDGTFYGCHSSDESAQDQIAVIEQSKNMDLSDLLVTPPINEIKDLDDKGTFGGYLINFGSLKEHDLERDFFDKKTDFWLDITGGKSAVLFGHGADEHFGKKRLDKDGGILAVKDAGVWMETQLQKRNEYEEMVQKLAEKGKLGLSSGTASHLVEREAAGKVDGKVVTHIKQWPIGLDATLTPTPAEPRLKVQPLGETEQKSITSVAKEVLGEFGVQGQAQNTQVMGESFDGNKDSDDKKEVSLRQKRDMIKGDFRSRFRDNNSIEGRPRVREIFDSYVIVKMDGKYYRVTYSGSVNEGYEFKDRNEWTEVVRDQRYIARDTAKEINEMLEDISGKFVDRNGPQESDEIDTLSDINNTLDSINETIN